MYFCSRIIHITVIKLILIIKLMIMEISELYSIFKKHPVVTTDSRDCPQGSIFVALKGESFDGNRFAAAALEKGCSWAVVDEAEYASDERCILVDDCLQTLQQLARHHRRQFCNPVIGITGTNGKTTTKELTAAVLAEKYNVLCTAGNFNNDIGVPKTLLRITPEHDIAVVEMGASHPGDIKTLVEIVEPDCGLITNVGRAHLLGFGSFEGVIRTKGELYDFLRTKPDSITFVNADNDILENMATGMPHVVGYGKSPRQETHGATTLDDTYVRGEVTGCAPFLRFRWREEHADGHTAGEWHEVQTHLIGAYNTDNMLAAITVGRHFGVDADRICHALENYMPSNNRSQMTVTEHNRLIVDAYNANPTSMAAAIDNFRIMEASPKMAILGDMGELGDVSADEHSKIVALLDDCGFDEVWLVGEEFGRTECRFRKFRNVDEVKEEINRKHIEGRYILIKGSHSTRLYELPEKL